MRSRPNASSAGVLDFGGLGGELVVDVLLAYVRAQDLEDHVADFVELEAEVGQDLGGDALVLLEEAEEQVLGADDVVAQLAGRLARELDDGAWRGARGELAEGHGGGGRGRDELLDLLADAA